MADTIRVHGLKELQQALRETEGRLPAELRAVNKQAAEIVATEARTEVPVLTGALQRSILAQGQQRKALVKAGSNVRVPYAGPIHFGWPRHHIRPNPFLYRALDRRRNEVIERYEQLVDELGRRF